MSTITHPHADFCLPRPGLDEPRIEAFFATKYGADGITIAGHIRCVRCQECGVTLYDGVRKD